MHTLAQALAALALLHVAAMWVPPVVWALWIARFVALETSLVGAALGASALGLGLGSGQPLVQAIGLVALASGLAPLVAALPAYAREGLSFSLRAWLTGGAVDQVAIERDVDLGEGLRADLYRAPGAGPQPFVVVVHGGSWRSGDKGEVARESRALAAAGYSVVDARYRLAPEHPFPAAVDDVRAVLRLVRAQAGALGLDPSRAALLGRSAGAQIALVAAYGGGSPDERGAPPSAVVSLYGPTDLAWCHAHPFVPDVVEGTSALEGYLGGAPGARPEAYRLATPMTLAPSADVATLILHGEAERCVRPVNARRLHDALVAKGKRSNLVMIPFAEHGFDVRPGGVGTQLARGVILAFLGRELARDLRGARHDHATTV